MRRLAFSRLLLLSVASAALLSSACIVHWGNGTSSLWGQDVETRGDVLYVDDVALPHHRWVDVSLDLAGVASLEVGTATGEIALAGTPDATAKLSVLLYGEIAGDGQPVIENGRLVARSAGGHKVFIDAVKGTIPAGIALHVASGTGSVLVEKLSGSGEVHGNNGTGTLAFRGCTAGSFVLECGTGDLQAENCTAASFQLDSGTGDILLKDCSAPEIRIESGTGDASLLRCKSDLCKVSTGTGDAEFVQCELGRLEGESGTGDLIVDGGKVKHASSSTGTGDFQRLNNPEVGDFVEH